MMTEAEAGAVDTALLSERFIDANYIDLPEPEAKKRPGPGQYHLKFGIVEAEFDPGKEGISARTGNPYSIPASVRVLPHLSIVSDADGSDEYAGVELNRFYALTSTPVTVYDRSVKARVPRNFSTLSAALALFGLEFPSTGNVADIIAVADGLSGLTTPKPITVTLTGQHRYRDYFQTNDGTYVNLNERAFRLGDAEQKLAAYKAGGGRWAALGYILDPDSDPQWTLDRPNDNVDHKKVYANLEPTEFGWKPR